MAKILIGKYEGTIYPEGDGYTGAISLGFGPNGKRKRLKRKGGTKTEVKDKLVKAVKDLESGITSSATPSRTGWPRGSRAAIQTRSKPIASWQSNTSSR